MSAGTIRQVVERWVGAYLLDVPSDELINDLEAARTEEDDDIATAIMADVEVLAAIPRGRCRSCDAPVLWVRMRSGKPMPLDAEPIKRVIVARIPGSKDWTGDVVDTYQSHFVSCPNRDRHRKKPAPPTAP